mgnify:CR=1 FL=1
MRNRRGMFAPLTIVLVGCLAFTFASSAQDKPEKIDLEVINKIKAEGLERSQVMQTLSWLTDVHGPRLTNSTNYIKAANWAKDQLTQWGLQNAHLESWGPFGRGWTLNGFTAAMTKPSYAPIIAYPKAWSGSTNGVVRGPVVYLKADNEEQLAQYKGKLKGAIVLVAAPQEVKAHFTALGVRTTDEQLLAMANADGQPGGRGGNFGGGGRGGPQQGAFALLNAKWKMIYEEGAGIVLEPGRGDGGDFIVSAAPDDVKQSTEEFLTLEASGWKRNRGAFLSEPALATFLRSAEQSQGGGDGQGSVRTPLVLCATPYGAASYVTEYEPMTSYVNSLSPGLFKGLA